MNKYLIWLWGQLPIPRRARAGIIWLLNPKFTVGVVGLIQDEQGRVLVLRHTYRPGKPWGLPGGGLRSGESLEDCLKREVREETGLKIDIDRLLSAGAHTERRLVDMIFSCHPRPGETLHNFKPNSEIAEAHYFSLDELPEAMPESQRVLIHLAAKQAGEMRKT